MNWTEAGRRDVFSFEMVDPFDLDASRGWMDGFVSGKVTQGYYTDTRYSAKLTFAGSGYIPGSLIRIHHDAGTFHEELGTFYVIEHEVTFLDGEQVEDFSLQSTLARVSENVYGTHFAVSNKTNLQALAYALEREHFTYQILETCPVYNFATPRVYDIGEDVLSVIFDMADVSGCRVDVDPHGVIQVIPSDVYSRTPVFTFADDNGTISGDISSEASDIYNKAVVLYTAGKSEVCGGAELPSEHPYSYAQTGRKVAKVYRVNDLQPPNSAAAQRLAQRYLNEISTEFRTYTFESIYVPGRAGDIYALRLDGETRFVMLQSRDIELSPGMKVKQTVREV